MSREEIYTTSPNELQMRQQLVVKIRDLHKRQQALNQNYEEMLRLSENNQSREAIEMREVMATLMRALNRSLQATFESSQKLSEVDSGQYFDTLLALGRERAPKKPSRGGGGKLEDNQKNMLSFWEKLVDENGKAVITQEKIAGLVDPKNTKGASMGAIVLVEAVVKAAQRWFQNLNNNSR